MRAVRHCSTLTVLLTTISTASAQVVDPEFDAQWGLAAIGAQYALEKGITGQGVVVGVVEGRFDATHPEFTVPNNSIGDFNYVVDPTAAAEKHATMVAGIIGAQRNGFGMEGLAPDVKLSSIQIWNDQGMFMPAPYTTIAQGYLQALEANIRVFNNSWSPRIDVTTATPQTAASLIADSAGTTPEDVENFFGALQTAVDTGAVLVWTTGNLARDQPNITAGLPYLFPSLQPSWIAVTSIKRDGTFDTDVNKCGVAKTWCISAPGVDVFAPAPPTPGGGPIPPNGYDTDEGTSFAAPFVTGAVALAKQMFPNAQGSELASLVLRTATDIGAPGVDDIFGWGLLNVGNLVNVLDPDDDPDDGDDNGALFVNASFARFAAVDTLVTTLWNRSAQRVIDASGATPTVSVAQAMNASQPLPPMALGGPPARDDLDTAVMLTNGRGPAIWAQGLGAYARIDGSPRASASLGGVIGGYDLIDNGNLSAGIALAFTSTDLDTRGTGDDSSAKGWHGFAYATWVENGWFLDGIVGGNWFDNTYRRTTIGGTTGTVLGNAGIAGYASNDTSGFAGRLTGGQLYQWGAGTIAPYAYLTVLHQRTGGASETGADIFSLAINAASLDQVEGGVGVRAQAGGTSWGSFTIAPSIDLAYGRLGGDVAFPVAFELLGSELSANAADIGRNVLRIGAQLDVLRFDNEVGGFIAYDGRFQENAQNNSFSAGAFVRF